jgi:hypothetical protein
MICSDKRKLVDRFMSPRHLSRSGLESKQFSEIQIACSGEIVNRQTARLRSIVRFPGRHLVRLNVAVSENKDSLLIVQF